MLLERIDASDEEDVEHVPVVGFLDTVTARELGIVEQIPTLFLGDLAADLVGVDDEAVRADSTGYILAFCSSWTALMRAIRSTFFS